MDAFNIAKFAIEFGAKREYIKYRMLHKSDYLINSDHKHIL